MIRPETLIVRLHKRAWIRRQISTRKSVQEGKPDRIADLLDEAAEALTAAQDTVKRHEAICWEAYERKYQIQDRRAADLEAEIKRLKVSLDSCTVIE